MPRHDMVRAATLRFASPQAAWLRGLPGDTSSAGARIELVNLAAPAPGSAHAAIGIRKGGPLAARLTRLAEMHALLRSLTLVVRTDSETGRDEIYRMTDVRVNGFQTMGEVQTLSLTYKDVLMTRAGWSNPGPPSDAPDVHPGGANKAWLHGLTPGGPLEVLLTGYRPPDDMGGMLLTIAGETLPEALRALELRRVHPEPLILVLPDTRTGDYVEYKLWDVTVESVTRAGAESASPALQLRLRSSVIEFLPERRRSR